MDQFGGIEKKTRELLAKIVRQSKSTVTVAEAVEILKLPRLQVAKLMARWAKQGWLFRIRRGLYAPVPLQAKTSEAVVEDPWIIANRIFQPCYIGGWSAVEHWGLTEQIFKTIVVVTTRAINQRKLKLQANEFWVKKVSPSSFFGTKIIWRERVQIQVSDPTKTMIDLLDDPSIGGGARMVGEIFNNYLASSNKNLEQLLDYASRMKNGAIYKRLGYFLERAAGTESSLLTKIRARLTTGNAKLDPSMRCNRLITNWRLWVPESWKEKQK